MICPNCGSDRPIVIVTRKVGDTRKRRYECIECGERFNTVERYREVIPKGRRPRQVVEVKRGRWVLGHVEPGYCTPGGNRPWVCSECGQVKSWMIDKPKEKFCDECGADMREEV